MHGVSGDTMFFQIISQMALFSKKVINTKCLFQFSLQLLPEMFLILGIIQRDTVKRYIGLHVHRYLLFLLDCNETWISSTLKKTPLKYIKLYNTPSSGSGVVLCRLMNGRTDMTKLIVGFPNFANMAKMYLTLGHDFQAHSSIQIRKQMMRTDNIVALF